MGITGITGITGISGKTGKTKIPIPLLLLALSALHPSQGNIPAPLLLLSGPEQDGILLRCLAHRPPAEVQLLWKNGNGDNLTGIPIPTESGNAGSALLLRPGSGNSASCWIRDPRRSTAAGSAVVIGDVFFPATSPWLPAFLILLIFGIFLVLAAAYKLRGNNRIIARERKAQQEIQEEIEDLKVELEEVMLKFQKENQEMVMKIEHIQAQLAFRRAQSHAVPLTLDKNCKHPDVTIQGKSQNLCANAQSQKNPETQNPETQNPKPQNPKPQNPKPQNPNPKTQNPKPQNPNPKTQNPETQNPNSQNPESQNPETQNPNSQNPKCQNPETQNSKSQNPETQNPNSQNPESQNPDSQNPDYQNPESQNPESPNPEPQNPKPQIPNPVFAVATEGFSGGKHYWEVEVGDGSGWRLGVLGEEIRQRLRNSGMGFPQEKAPGLEYSQGEFRLSGGKVERNSGSCRVVGVFLDQESQKSQESQKAPKSQESQKSPKSQEFCSLSFFDVEEKKLLGFIDVKIPGNLFPFFCPGPDGNSLGIRPVGV